MIVIRHLGVTTETYGHHTFLGKFDIFRRDDVYLL